MIKTIQKYSLAIISLVAILVTIHLIAHWQSINPLQRVSSLLFIFISIHTWEEKCFGFEELNQANLNGLNVNDGIGYLMLLLLTLYIGIVPLFFPQIPWLTCSIFILGFVEVVAHTLAIRMQTTHRFYNAGIATAYTLLPVTAIVGFYTLAQQGHFTWQNLVLGFLNLAIPLLLTQVIAVKSAGASYRTFLKNTRQSMKKH